MVRTAGYVGLTFGVGVTLLVALFVGLVGSLTAALVTAGVLLGVTLLFALPMLLGGRKLEASGNEEQTDQRVQAVFALAANRGGVLKARDAAVALDLGVEEADRFLTELAKKKYGDIEVDVSERGEVVYTFPRLLTVGPSDWNSALHPRVSTDERGRLRVEVPKPNVPQTKVGVPSAGPPQPVVLDADFEDIDEPGDRARRRA